VVAKSRHMNTEEVDKIARGRVWAGATAFNLKLVDKLGGLDEAINEAKKLANIPPEDEIGMQIYPRKKSFLDVVFELMGAKARTQGPAIDVDVDPVHQLETKLNMYKKFFPAYLMPYQISIDYTAMKKALSSWLLALRIRCPSGKHKKNLCNLRNLWFLFFIRRRVRLAS
jgi:protease-4